MGSGRKTTSGGTIRLDNIARCCLMCKSIKAARLYERFVPFFRLFLEPHGREHRAANPDDWSTVGAMTLCQRLRS